MLRFFSKFRNFLSISQIYFLFCLVSLDFWCDQRFHLIWRILGCTGNIRFLKECFALLLHCIALLGIALLCYAIAMHSSSPNFFYSKNGPLYSQKKRSKIERCSVPVRKRKSIMPFLKMQETRKNRN